MAGNSIKESAIGIGNFFKPASSLQNIHRKQIKIKQRENRAEIMSECRSSAKSEHLAQNQSGLSLSLKAPLYAVEDRVPRL